MTDTAIKIELTFSQAALLQKQLSDLDGYLSELRAFAEHARAEHERIDARLPADLVGLIELHELIATRFYILILLIKDTANEDGMQS